MTQRKRRTSIHKGKVRYGIKVPRKLKKLKKKEMDLWSKNFQKHLDYLQLTYGDDWFSHVIFGG